jgi:hypothetical protein
MYFRLTKSGKNQYLQIVTSYREDGKVRQRVLGTLGRLDRLQESGELERLLHNGLKHCRQGAVLTAHERGEAELESIRRIGADLVFAPLWEEVGIGPVLRALGRGARHGFDLERAVYLTVLHRLFAGGSDRAAERWREDYLLPGTERLQLHQLYRAMAYLGEATGPADSANAGWCRSRKDQIEEELFGRRRDLFTEVDLVFFDTTTLYFEGQGGPSIGRRGHSKDHRPDLPQMVVGMVVDGSGRPLCSEMWPGNTTDVTTLIPVVNRLRERFRVRNICVVADRGMFSDSTLQVFEGHDPPIQYIVGARMRRQKEVGEMVLENQDPWQEIYPERRTAKEPAPLKVKEVRVGTRRYVVCCNEEERRKDAHDRAAIVEQLGVQLKNGAKSLVGNKGYRRYLACRPGGGFVIDETSVAGEARFDGIFVIRTNTDLPAEQVALTYKNLWVVEAIFRTTKSILQTRPIYHKCDETIRGHVFCSFLALTLKWELEERMRQAAMQWEWREVIRGLNALQEVTIAAQGQRFRLRGKLSGHALQAIRAAGVTLPKSFVALD